jgi:4a-hydroxytetrahydrobiopterin dehydratase
MAYFFIDHPSSIVNLKSAIGVAVPSELAAKKCVPCRGGVPPLKGPEVESLLSRLGGGWRVVDEHHLEKEYRFKNFKEALDFANQVGRIAEEQGHHPDIYLAWGKVGLKIWTHKIDGLTESDFVLAAKADAALEQLTSAK